MTQSIASRLRDQFPMIHPLMLAAVAAESEWEYYGEEPRGKDHPDTKNLPGMKADDTAAAQAPAEDETSLMETSIVETPRFGDIRDRETIDSELRLLAAARRSIREHGIEPSNQVDELLDERLAHSDRAGEDAAVENVAPARSATFHPKNVRFPHPCMHSPKGADRMVTRHSARAT